MCIRDRPFTVLLPGRRVGVETPELHYAPGRASGDGESVMAMYVGNGANRFWFKMRAKPDPELGESLEWTEPKSQVRNWRFRILKLKAE